MDEADNRKSMKLKAKARASNVKIILLTYEAENFRIITMIFET